MKRALISYSHAELAEVRALARIVRQAGVRPWRDQDDLVPGRKAEDEIRRAIREETLGSVVWLSRSAIDSRYVMDIELPEILARHEAGGYAVVPVFRGLSPTEAADLVRSRTGLEIGGFQGVPVPQDADPTAAMHRVAQAFIEVRLQELGAGERPVVRAVTRDDTAGRLDEAALDFDWRHAYGELTVPDPVSMLALKEGLRGSLSALLAVAGAGAVNLDLKTHLSVGVAIGHALRRPTGAVPVVAHDGTEWAAEPGSPNGASQLEENLVTGPAEGEDLAVEVSISREVGPGVDRLVSESGLPFRGRLKFRPLRGPSQLAVPDAATANAWAEQIVERMVEVRNQLHATSLALFIAAPLPVGVFIGWRSNAAGALTIYEWAANTGPYVPAWSLP